MASTHLAGLATVLGLLGQASAPPTPVPEVVLSYRSWALCVTKVNRIWLTLTHQLFLTPFTYLPSPPFLPLVKTSTHPPRIGHMGSAHITQLSSFALLSLLLPGCSDSVPPYPLAPGLAHKMEGPVSLSGSAIPLPQFSSH